MRIPALRYLAAIFALLTLLAVGIAPRSTAIAAPTQPNDISYWGMNLYLTKRERIGRDNLSVLADTAKSAGVQWTREELPWDLIEPANGTFITENRDNHYNTHLKLTADKGFGIIGMLLTTPQWARDAACRGNYWCPPADVNQYAEFAAYMTERYDGDGLRDAPGSPRIAAWEIWNEPNDTLLWPNIGGDANARKRRYGDMLVAAYKAIKAADPTAKVLIGGVYIYDGSNAGGIEDGLYFLNAAGGVFQQVPAAKQAFDIFSIHPYIPTDRPDAPQIPPRITVEGRVRTTRTWLNNDIGRSDAPIWITEMGWCTEGNCPGGVRVSEEQQANFLTRSMVIAQQNGVQHTSWFQFEDAFNDLNREWGGAAIVRNLSGSSYPTKPAYNAYRTLAQQLAGAVVAGPGPVHTHRYNHTADQGNPDETYDYRYTRGTTTIDVLWRPAGTATVSFPVTPGAQVTILDRDGGQLSYDPAQLPVSERPIFVVQTGEGGGGGGGAPIDMPHRVYLPLVRR